MKNPEWIKWWARKFSASRYEVIAQIFNGEFAQTNFGATMPNMLVVPERGNHALYLDKNEWDRFARALYQTVASSRDAFASYKKMIKRDQQHFVGVCGDIGSQDLKEASEGQLLEWFEDYIEAYKRYFQTSIMIPFIVEPMVSDDARKELEDVLEERKLGEKMQHYFDAIFLPEEKNAITQEREDLLRIAEDTELHSLSEKDLTYRLEEHTDKYQWIPCYDINDEPWTVDTFRKLYEELRTTNWQEELEDMVHFGNRAQGFQTTLDELVTTVEQRTLFSVAHETVFLKDERDDYRRRGSFLIQPFFQELGRRMGDLTLDEVANLLQREVQVFLGTGRLPLAGKIKERKDGFVMLKGTDVDEIHIYSGQEAKDKAVEQIGEQTELTGDSIEGVIASEGVAKGPAKLVLTKDDLSKIEAGDIMVAVTTHPDFVPSMRKCAAVITDEGGLTSHAAIVSRELQIPCIVGTQSATQTFKDGELLMVDATSGIVSKQKSQ